MEILTFIEVMHGVGVILLRESLYITMKTGQDKEGLIGISIAGIVRKTFEKTKVKVTDRSNFNKGEGLRC